MDMPVGMLQSFRTYVMLKHPFSTMCIIFNKGHPPSADLIYGEEDSISPSTLVLANSGYILFISPLISLRI